MTSTDNTDIAYLSATDAIRMFTSRELSPVELMTAVIARAEKTEPVVNALVHRRFDEAMDAARAAERVYTTPGSTPRPLEGIPFAMKEETNIAGQPWTHGSLLSKDQISDSTSIIAQRILDTGAIVHARSTTPEFSAAPYTQSRLWGVTRNPWNPEFSPGGSSGGSAASLAAGSTTLASGSDIAGSIRIPASFSGIVGFKPPYGRVPVDPPYNLDTFMHNGPMARTVADAVLLQNLMAGPHSGDMASLRPLQEVRVGSSDLRGLRIAVSVDLGDWLVDPEVRRNTLETAEELRSLGATVEEVEVNLPRAEVMRAYGVHAYPNIEEMDSFMTANADHLSPYLAGNMENWREKGKSAAPGEFFRLANELNEKMAAVLRDFDVFICPTVNTRGYRAEELYLNGIEIDGQWTANINESVMTMPFNIMSRYPVLSVPSGFADNSVPTGVQIVGPTYDDDSVFRIAAALEMKRPLWGTSNDRPHITI